MPRSEFNTALSGTLKTLTFAYASLSFNPTPDSPSTRVPVNETVNAEAPALDKSKVKLIVDDAPDAKF